MYDPIVARWWSVDPLAEKAPSFNPYRCAYDNPVRYYDPTGLLEDDHYINEDGTVRTVKTSDAFDRFFVQDSFVSGGYRVVAQLDKNENGLVQFPENGVGFDRYGTVDAGGNSNSPTETVGEGDHYLQPEVAAALFGVISNLHSEYNFNIHLGDMSSSNGSDPWQQGERHHGGHGHMGNRSGMDVDFRYLNENGISFQDANAFSNSNFSSLNNQRVYDTAKSFGFTLNYQGTNGNLSGVTLAGGHNDHGHLGMNYAKFDWRFVDQAPTPFVINSFYFNFLNR